MDGFMIARMAATGVGMGIGRVLLQWWWSRSPVEERDSSGSEDVPANLRIAPYGSAGNAERGYAIEQRGGQKLLPPPSAEHG
jgi:hypothetical protein